MSEPFHTATYSPEDNKLRLYASARLDAECYATVKAAGFSYAPKQELFVCPRWTPAAEKLALELVGSIEDEDTSLVERAEERVDRFENYSEKRAAESEATFSSVRELADGIPFGQPILVGHHSERRARRDAQRIENGMRKAISLFETSDYWTRRAQGVISSASYKDRPAVRARRIQKLQAERRVHVRSFTPKDPNETMLEQRWSDHLNGNDTKRIPHVYVGASRGGRWVPVEDLPALERGAQRWIAHLDMRIAYETELLKAQGSLDMLTPKARPKKPPLLNYKAAKGIRVQNRFNPEISLMPQQELTKGDYARIYSDYKGTNVSEDGSHRVRIAVVRGNYFAVFLTDSKVHEVAA